MKKEFLELLEKNAELKEKIIALGENPAVADVIALAKKYGVTLTEADFAEEQGELSEDELDAVAGGVTNGVGCIGLLFSGSAPVLHGSSDVIDSRIDPRLN